MYYVLGQNLSLNTISRRKFSSHIVNLFPLNIHRNFSLLCLQFLGRKGCVNLLSSPYEVLAFERWVSHPRLPRSGGRDSVMGNILNALCTLLQMLCAVYLLWVLCLPWCCLAALTLTVNSAVCRNAQWGRSLVSSPLLNLAIVFLLCWSRVFFLTVKGGNSDSLGPFQIQPYIEQNTLSDSGLQRYRW